MFHRLALILALGAAPALAAAATPVTVSKPWMRYLLPSIPAAGYMVLNNTGPADETLTAAASPACGMLMLHKSQDSSGMAMMMDVPSITIPAHGSVTFAPGGYHLMCMSPSMQLGEKIPITLSFQDGDKLYLSAPVYGAQTSP
jgi:copper(I)-binding protein